MTSVRSFSLGRQGEAQWEQLRAAYVLSQRSGEIVLVTSDSRDVRDEVRRRLEAMASRVEVIEPGNGVTLAVHALAKRRAEGEKLPVAWIEAPASSPSPEADMRWIEALALLNQTRDALQMHGPCHVVLAGPRALHRVVTTRAPDLNSFIGGHVLLLDDTLEELVTQQGTLTWLHLSDLHVQSESWQQDHVLGALVRDLPKLLEERELRPDLLFVTGDVAARGQRSEYDGAVRVLDEVAKQLGIDRRQQVFVVPGNHDVDRAKVNPLSKLVHASLLGLSAKEFRNTVGNLLGDARQFGLYGERLEEWCTFTETLLGRARSVSVDRPWRSDVIDVRGLPVGVLSLCTAWASGPDDRKGSLILGERQIHDMVAEARDGGAQMVIALMHHPLHWLHDGEYSAIRGRLEREVDVVLHGHVHDAHVALHLAASSEHMEIGAGAAYAGLDEDPYHGFSVGRLDVATGRLDVHCFTWSTQSGRWHPAAGVPGADDSGRVVFSFSPAALAPEASRRGGQEVLATRLRHAAAKVYATVDFAGLRAGGPRRHVTLEQIFVPLRLAAKGLDSADPSWFEDPSEEVVAFERGEPEEDIPDDAETWRPRYDAPEGAVVDVTMRVSGRVTLAGLDAMLAAGRTVVVLGGPGSGKSTLAKYVASTAAQREGGPVPLLLTVRDWIAEGKRDHLLDMAARQASTSLSVRTDRAALEALCEGGRVVLIVDGVDEAADAEVRRELRNQVHSFVAAYPRVPVLVTSRIAGYHEIPLDDDEFDELTLEPFDDEAIEQFVRRWYDLVEDDPTVRLRKRVDLLHALDVEPRAKELARNPLLATLIGMVHFSHAQLPGDRARLYGLIVEQLLITWPAERRRELPELHGTVQQPMLESLALRLQEQRAGAKDREDQAEVLIDVEQLESMLEELLAEHLRERTIPERRYLARKWGKWLIDDCGLLQEQQPGRVGFLHLSLMEYMAGRALFERTVGGGYDAVAELVRERHNQAVWRETLLLMLGSENKKRELGQAVVQRLLDVKSDVRGTAWSKEWSACIFGLALLREDMDVGEERGRLLEAACRAALDVWPYSWKEASGLVHDLVRFGRAHGAGTRAWLNEALAKATGDRLVGIIAMTTSFPWDETQACLLARGDLSAVTSTLLSLEPDHPAGAWARERATASDWLGWAHATPMTGILPRSFEFLPATSNIRGAAAVSVASLLDRASWVGSVLSGESTREMYQGCPRSVSWMLGDDALASIRLDWAFAGRRQGRSHRELIDAGFSKKIGRHLAKMATLNCEDKLLPRHASLTIWSSPDSEPYELLLKFVEALRVQYVLDGLPQLMLELGEDATRPGDCAPGELVDHIARQLRRRWYVPGVSELMGDFAERLAKHVTIQVARGPLVTSSSVIFENMDAASTETEEMRSAATAFLGMVAEGHAALVLEEGKIAATLAILRIQNRWLNLFFTPLVERATWADPKQGVYAEHAREYRPLADHPDLHALLLTYGLVQYQTTWEWPDCPHWRSWLSSDPPAHWLPAHVYHLIRTIQDPTNPTHRDLATAALDRNDFPELAQALRETTLVPTPPEILALFDHGTPADDEPSASR